ncbi:MAG: M18 family aminopeptidase [Acidimicrobiales bacterium mtb01]|nr:M18 family aminopeptidase [Actinomycetota bacterium]TEX45961.1 MAG: M18 family aminopeptidase [Acidimicrobiales bacterium mtb01]
MTATTDRLGSLLAHLDASVSPSHSVAHVANRLEQAGFVRSESLTQPASRGFHATQGLLIAWVDDGSSADGFRVIGAHTDSPCLRVKPRPDAGAFGWKQVGVEIYGGILNNSWLDRDLGVAGRVTLADGSSRLFRSSEAVARVPQLAVHLDRDVNDKGLVLDRQNHLLPVWGLGSPRSGEFAEWIAAGIGVAATDIVSWELSLFDDQPARTIGVDSELLASGRIDNQVSCWAATEAIVRRSQSSSGPTSVIALFDHEEVGSESTHGAGGPWLEWILEALHSGTRTSFHEALSHSSCLSADCAHSVHPNYPERHEPAHRPVANGGPVLKQNANQRYATSPETAAFFVRCCREAGTPHQVFVSKNSMPCGSTIGPIASTRLGIPTVDAGVAQLSMHSARELCGVSDVLAFADVAQRFVELG